MKKVFGVDFTDGELIVLLNAIHIYAKFCSDESMNARFQKDKVHFKKELLKANVLYTDISKHKDELDAHSQ